MATQMLGKQAAASRPLWEDVPTIPQKEGRLDAITIDMDIELLKLNYGDPYDIAYGEIRKVLLKQGFAWQQGSVYLGGETLNAVTCSVSRNSMI